MGLTSLATSMIGTFFYLQTQDNIFFRENIYIRMMPLIGIIVLYFCTTFAESIPMIIAKFSFFFKQCHTVWTTEFALKAETPRGGSN